MRKVITAGLTLSLLAGAAHADTAPPEARQHWAACVKAFNQEKYQVAVDECSASYDIYPTPLLLFSIGQAYRLRKNHPDKALHYYRQYLAEAPHGRQRQTVEELIPKLEAQLATQQTSESAPPHGIAPPPEPPPPVTTPPPPPPLAAPAPVARAPIRSESARDRRAASWAAIGLLGGTLACAAVATALWVDAATITLAPPGVTERQQQDLGRGSDNERIAAYVLIGVGALALAGSAVGLYFWKHPRRAVALRFAPTLGGTVVSVGGTL